jgi:hypothetical protein
MLPPPLILSMQIGYNGLERRQSDGRNRHSGDNKRNRKNVRKKHQMTALIGNKRQRGGSGVAETEMATDDEGDEDANSSSSGDRQGSDRHHIEWTEIGRTEIDRMANRTEIVEKSDDNTDRKQKTARWKWSSGNRDGN